MFHQNSLRITTSLLIATNLAMLSWVNAAQAENTSTLPDRVTFNAHIRPIMSNTCFVCHGPDEEDNASGFKLDTFTAATSRLPSDDELAGITPNDPLRSEIYLRITGKGSGEQMPPGDFRHQLSDYDKALFRKWIEQGAEYEQHWSYAPLERPAVPQIEEFADEIANSIDAFILAKLQQNGIQPGPMADKRKLLRRLSLDLIGLPPTTAELEAFLADESKDAYARQVDRLMNSEHYGERMASSWLDLVRFADTVGFHGDQNQRIFPYRDYVIDAFNNNKPFDEFTREQLAGDLLANPTDEQLIATGFLRLNMMTREGGAQPEEYLAKYKADRVRTLGTAWLGSTLGCCECHNHKYDPFTAKDFYSLGAFFDDVRQWGVYSYYGYSPNKDLVGLTNDSPFPPELRTESQSLLTEIRLAQAERDKKLLSELGEETLRAEEYSKWAASMADFLKSYSDGWMPAEIVDASTSHATETEVLADGSLLLRGKGDGAEVITVTTKMPKSALVNSLRLEVLPDENHSGFVGRGADGQFEVNVAVEVIEDPQQKSLEVVPNHPRFIRVELPGRKRVLSLAEVQVFVEDSKGKLKNIATKGKASQSSTAYGRSAKRANDGNTSGDYHQSHSVTRTSTEGNPWWELDLGSAQAVKKVVIWNRTDGNAGSQIKGFRVSFLNAERRRLYSTKPKMPQPSVELLAPAKVEIDTGSRPIEIAWAEADRKNPLTYRSGRELLTLGKTWRSGPARWQLPSDETRLKHTADFHFQEPLQLEADAHLVVRLASSNVGRVKLAVTPLGHAVVGRAAAADSLMEALNTDSEQLNTAQQAALVSAFHRSTLPIKKQHETSRYYRDRIARLRGGWAMTLVAQSIPEDQLPVSRVLPRGNWQDNSGELAPPNFPEFLPQAGITQDRRLNRLDLANWLMSTKNPIPARHFANRTWKHFFGAGLSGKLDDLGNQGEWPSHPLLLNWLASEFMQSGWDMKHLVRTIVTSRTYRQAAAVRRDLQEIDPYNRLLSQQSARRLEAEIIRDNALSIAGLLSVDHIGGPSVFPYQPAGHYSNLQFPDRRYQASRDDRQYRRGVYMHWQRTFLHPMLVNFDAPSRDECTADRPMSNSPQQALSLLNDPSFVEASVAMAARVLTESTSDDPGKVLDYAFEIALARRATEEERNALLALLERQKTYFTDHPEDAKKLLSIGLPRPDVGIDASKQAAWAQVCRVILNLHEIITRF